MKTFILILTIMSSTTQTGNSVSQLEFSSKETCMSAANAWTKTMWKAREEYSLYGYPIAICVPR